MFRKAVQSKISAVKTGSRYSLALVIESSDWDLRGAVLSDIQSRLLVLFVLTSVLALGLAVTTTGTIVAVDNKDATLELVENTTTDETISVDLQTSATNVAGYQTHLTYDPNVLSVTAVDGVALNDPVTNDNLSGAVSFTQSQQQMVNEPTLATVTFDIVNDGETKIGFIDNKTGINDDTGEHLDISLNGLDINTTDGDNGGIGGINRGSNSDQGSPELDSVNTETDNGAGNDINADQDDDTGEPPNKEQDNTHKDSGQYDEDIGGDEQMNDANESDDATDATPILSEGIVSSTVILGILIVTISGIASRLKS